MTMHKSLARYPVLSSVLTLVLGFFVIAFSATFASAQTPAAPPSDDGPDPALANMAPADAAAMQANGQQTQDQQGYPQQAPAPIVRSAPTPDSADSYNAPPAATDNQAPADAQADANAAAGEAAINDANLAADQPPPPLPDYDQPPPPADNYLWTPGYWGYADAGYYWVPGVWINPPYYGALWTPPYWGYYGGRYRWHPGYWGLHIGFYGGVNYGFGYIGTGYFGGYWAGRAFYYNRSVTTVGVNVTNVYNRTVIYNGRTYGPAPVNHISYNGGRGGIALAPRPAEIAAMHEPHLAPLAAQARLHQSAAQNPQAAFSNNRGRPPVAAQTKPLGATRTVSADQNAFQRRPDFQQQQHPNLQPNAQQQRSFQPSQQHSAPPQPRPQSRPAPAPKPASHPAPAASHASSTKH